MHNVHLEVLLADAYALFLVVVATILELAARHSHSRSEHFRNSRFVYKRSLDVWECPTGHHLKREIHGSTNDSAHPQKRRLVLLAARTSSAIAIAFLVEMDMSTTTFRRLGG